MSLSSLFPTRWSKTLISIEKGKRYDGSFTLEGKEAFRIKFLMLLWAICWVLFFVSMVLWLRHKLHIAFVIILGASLFVVPAILFGYLFYVGKQNSNDIRYYSVDSYHNAITGKHKDRTVEISKEEFYGDQR